MTTSSPPKTSTTSNSSARKENPNLLSQHLGVFIALRDHLLKQGLISGKQYKALKVDSDTETLALRLGLLLGAVQGSYAICMKELGYMPAELVNGEEKQKVTAKKSQR